MLIFVLFYIMNLENAILLNNRLIMSQATDYIDIIDSFFFSKFEIFND